MIHPVKGMCFIIEDVQDAIAGASKLKESGFVQSDTHEQRSGVSGVVFAVNDSPKKCMSCGKCEMEPVGIKVGDRVLFSKFVAEQVSVKDDQGQEIKRLKSVPLDAVLAILS